VIPDPVAFVGEALAAQGALVEATAFGLEVLAPPELAAVQGTPESFVLVARSVADLPHAIVCGLGTPLCDRHVAEARAGCPRCDLRLAGAPRLGHARALAERLVIRNGKSEVRDASPGRGRYLAVDVAWTAEADDRFEGRFTLALEPASGSAPDPRLVGAAFELGEPAESAPVIGSGGIADAAAWVHRRTARPLEHALSPIIAGVQRRHAREHDRIVGYFAALATEAASARRKVDPAALAARLAQYAQERDSKLAGLGERYTLDVTTRLASSAWIEADRATVGVRMFRRKAHSDITVHLPVGAQELDRIACEGCGDGLGAVALCDAALHMLCERCAPSAQGRIACPACG